MNFCRRFKYITCRKKDLVSADHQTDTHTAFFLEEHDSKLPPKMGVGMQSYCTVILCAPQHRQRCCTFLVLVSVDHFSTLGRLAAVSGVISLDRQQHRYETPPISIAYSQ